MQESLDCLLATTPAPPYFRSAWAKYLLQKSRLGSLEYPRPLDLLLIGDSLCEAWPAADWKDWLTVNLGLGGDKTQHVLWRLDNLPTAAIVPERVLVLIGTNNILQGELACGTVEGVDKIMSRLAHLYPNAMRWIVVTPPFKTSFQSFIDERGRLSRELRERCADACILVDHIFLDKHGLARERLYDEDGVHISIEGYHALTEFLLPIFGV